MKANEVIPENWLHPVNIEKFTSATHYRDKSQPSKYASVIGRGSGL